MAFETGVHRERGTRSWGLLAAGLLAFGLPAGLRAVGPAERPDAPAPAAANAPKYERSVVEVDVPDVALLDQAGRSTRARELLDRGHPVAVNFFFASCRSICPVMTSTFASMRERLGKDDDLRMVSVTIDPEQDTPEVLRAYSARFGAGPGWSFLTGVPEDVLALQKAFGADAGGKFNHRPLYFLRAPGASSWVRLEGLGGAAELASEVRSLTAPRSAAR